MANTTDIKVGDYIIGKERWGREAIPEYDIESTLCTHEMRGWVSSIYVNTVTGKKSYDIQSDDAWRGARGGFISEELGPVTKVKKEDIEPFWWRKKKVDSSTDNQADTSTDSQADTSTEKPKTWVREWKTFDLVRHFKGKLFRIIGIATDTETKEEIVIFKRADNTGKLWSVNREIFESEVDKKYTNATQQWSFEKVEE